MNDPSEETTQVGRAPALPPPGHLEAGAVLGDLQLTRLVGEGLSSLTYQATNLLLGRPCAVKLVRPELGAGAVARGRARHTVLMVDRLAIAGIASTFGFGLAPDGTTTYLVQEWVDGTSLRAALAHHGALSRRAYLPLVRQLCQRLAAAHAAGIAHLALHAGNVMIVQQPEALPEVKLLDFGIHHLHPKPGEQPPELVRRPEHAFHLAPEQAKGQPGDSRSDVYALCTLLYEMITGRPPFLGQTFGETVDKIISEAPQTPGALAAIPSELEATLLRGLDKDPGRRIPSVEALLAALDPLSATTGQQPALSRSPSMERRLADLPATTPERQARTSGAAADSALRPPKRRLPLFIAIGALAALGAGIGLYLLLRKSAASTTVSARRPPPERPFRRPALRRAPRAVPLPRPQPSTAKAVTATAAPTRGTAAPMLRPPRAIGRSRIAGVRLAGVKRITGVGTIKVLTGNPAAKIFLDGRYVGSGSLRVLSNIPAGKHRLHLELAGKKLPAKDIELQPQGSLELTL